MIDVYVLTFIFFVPAIAWRLTKWKIAGLLSALMLTHAMIMM